MNIKTLNFILMSSCLAGCAYQTVGKIERPDGIAADKTMQTKVASAAHWKLLADNEAKIILNELKDKSISEPVFLQRPALSVFSETFHDLLTSSLVGQNGVVTNNDQYPAVTVSYNVNVVRHRYGMIEPETLTPGASFAYYVTTDAMEIIKAPFYAIKDQFYAKNLSTISEVVITTQAIANDIVASSHSSVYYIETVNGMNYMESYRNPDAPLKEAKIVNVIGGKK